MSTPDLLDILLNPDLGPQIISILPLSKKKDILRALHPIDPELVTHYLQLLWSCSWCRRGSMDALTGLYQEELPFPYGWGTRKMKITDLDIEPPYW